MSEFRTVPVMAGTNLRRGGSTKGDVDAPNVVFTGLPKKDYVALVQCAGQDVDDLQDGHHNRNYWWVLIDTPHGRHWISAVRIAEGGDNEPIDGVTQAATVFDAPFVGGALSTVHVVSVGAILRRGGSTRNEQLEDVAFAIPGGPYTALAQCGGEDVTIGGRSNFRWVLLDTPQGPGWVSAVLLEEGPDNGRIPGVPAVPTVFSLPPDLLP